MIIQTIFCDSWKYVPKLSMLTRSVRCAAWCSNVCSAGVSKHLIQKVKYIILLQLGSESYMNIKLIWIYNLSRSSFRKRKFELNNWSVTVLQYKDLYALKTSTRTEELVTGVQQYFMPPPQKMCYHPPFSYGNQNVPTSSWQVGEGRTAPFVEKLGAVRDFRAETCYKNTRVQRVVCIWQADSTIFDMQRNTSLQN